MLVHNPNKLPTISIADLIPTQGDLKDLSTDNYEKLKKNIERRGFIDPVAVWEDKNGIKYILNGHQRQRVLTNEGWLEPIPYFNVPAKTLQEAAAIVLELTSQYGKITQEGLDAHIAKYDLPEAEIYEATHFDALSFYDTSEPEQEVEDDEAPEVDESEPPKSKLGKIYQLGRHRVMCGDSTDFGAISDLLDGEEPELLFTDPPYRMEALGGSNQWVGKQAAKLGESIKDIIDFEPAAFLEVVKELFKPKMNAYIFCNKDLLPDYLNWAKENKYGFNLLVWKKPNALPLGGQHRPDIEYIVKAHKNAPWNNGLKDVNYSKCLEYGRDNSEAHPTIKPLGLIANELRISSNKQGNVLDLFLGSGSTLIACEQTDRTCYGMELDPKYVDVIRKRYAKFIQPDDQLPENWEELTPAIND